MERGMTRVVNIFNPGVYYNELVHGWREPVMMTMFHERRRVLP